MSCFMDFIIRGKKPPVVSGFEGYTVFKEFLQELLARDIDKFERVINPRVLCLTGDIVYDYVPWWYYKPCPYCRYEVLSTRTIPAIVYPIHPCLRHYIAEFPAMFETPKSYHFMEGEVYPEKGEATVTLYTNKHKYTYRITGDKIIASTTIRGGKEYIYSRHTRSAPYLSAYHTVLLTLYRLLQELEEKHGLSV